MRQIGMANTPTKVSELLELAKESRIGSHLRPGYAEREVLPRGIDVPARSREQVGAFEAVDSSGEAKPQSFMFASLRGRLAICKCDRVHTKWQRSHFRCRNACCDIAIPR